MCTSKTGKIHRLHATTKHSRLHITELCRTARNQKYFQRDSQQ